MKKKKLKKRKGSNNKKRKRSGIVILNTSRLAKKRKKNLRTNGNESLVTPSNDNNDPKNVKFFFMVRNITKSDSDDFVCSDPNSEKICQSFPSKYLSIFNCKMKKTMGFEYEKNEFGSRIHYSMSLSSYIDKLKGNSPKRFHEILFDDRPTKFTLDIEFDRIENSDLDFYQFINQLIDNIIKFFAMIGCEGISRNWFRIMDSTRKNKFSVHLIMFVGYIFENTVTLVCFINALKLWILELEIRELENKISPNLPKDQFTKSIKLPSLTYKVNGIGISSSQSSHNRVSSLAYKVNEIEMPTRQSPFGKKENDEPEKKRIIGFSSAIDTIPFENTDGTLRCCYSTKYGHENDDLYYLKPGYICVLENNPPICEFIPLNKMEPDDIVNTLSQAIQLRVNDVETKIITLSKDLHKYIVYENLFHNKLIRYNHLFYKFHKNPKLPKTDEKKFISYKEIKSLYEGGGGNVENFFGKMLSSGFAKSKDDGVPEEFKCKYELSRDDFPEIHAVVENILKEYGNSIYIKQLFKYSMVPTLVRIRINKLMTSMAIIVKNCKCAIIMRKYNRFHNSHIKKSSTPSVYFKYTILNGRLYQKCVKDKCTQKWKSTDQKSERTECYFFSVNSGLMEKIQELFAKKKEEIENVVNPKVF